ncbi:hypothetical protein ACM26V_19730 [Salipaludibacillus sp. HK11]|uniref:hypothetical protein n=1 Tax=Salipaludibacillus sp. HK11 TaxID=3394320 RepID=UPI0039FD5E7B
MASGFGREGSQAEASCAPCRVGLERKGDKRERLVTHVEWIWKGRVTREKRLVPHVEWIWKGRVTRRSVL